MKLLIKSSYIGVLTYNGATALILTPFLAYSLARLLTAEFRAALLALYRLSPGSLPKAARELMATMLVSFLIYLLCFKVALARAKKLKRFILISSLILSKFRLRSSIGLSIPAQWIKPLNLNLSANLLTANSILFRSFESNNATSLANPPVLSN